MKHQKIYRLSRCNPVAYRYHYVFLRLWHHGVSRSNTRITVGKPCVPDLSDRPESLRINSLKAGWRYGAALNATTLPQYLHEDAGLNILSQWLPIVFKKVFHPRPLPGKSWVKRVCPVSLWTLTVSLELIPIVPGTLIRDLPGVQIGTVWTVFYAAARR